MKKMAIGLIMAVVLGFYFQVQAAEQKEQKQELQISGTLDVGYYTQYVGSLSGSTIFDSSVFQEYATITLEPIGLYFMPWHSYSPKGGPNKDPGDEIDAFFGIKRRVGKFTFNLGYSYYDFYKLGDTKTDAHGFYLITDFPEILGLTPFLWIEEDVNVHGGKGGFYYRGGVSHTWKFLKNPIINLTLCTNFSLAGHDEAFGKRAEAVSSIKLSVSSNLKFKKLTITPVVDFQKRVGHKINEGGVTQDRIWGGINFSLQL